eukprot:913237-Prorocentrum_lima.AAC.1
MVLHHHDLHAWHLRHEVGQCDAAQLLGSGALARNGIHQTIGSTLVGGIWTRANTHADGGKYP